MASFDCTQRTTTMSPKARRPLFLRPVALSASSTPKAWKGLNRFVSSSAILQARCTIAIRRGVTSPTQRVASPGPGNGMRSLYAFGSPTARATARTPGLYRLLSGSRAWKP